MKTLALLLLMACGTVESATGRITDRRGVPIIWDHAPVTWSFNYEFPEAMKPSWSAGFAYWNLILGREQFRELDCDGVCLEQTPDVMVTQGLEIDGQKAVATTRFNSLAGVAAHASIFYFGEMTTYDEDTRISVARHEVGHVLGLGHNPNGPCLMFPIIWPEDGLKPVCPTDLRTLQAMETP